jgi:hypothetical protein
MTRSEPLGDRRKTRFRDALSLRSLLFLADKRLPGLGSETTHSQAVDNYQAGGFAPETPPPPMSFAPLSNSNWANGRQPPPRGQSHQTPNRIDSIVKGAPILK